jgi:Trk-type K+ transport system membrane component
MRRSVREALVGFSILAAVAGFVTIYIGSYVVLSLAVAATGEDVVTAFSIVASCMNNVGPALGKATATVQDLNDAAVWLCSFAMLLGRLEVFTLLNWARLALTAPPVATLPLRLATGRVLLMMRLRKSVTEMEGYFASTRAATPAT